MPYINNFCFPPLQVVGIQGISELLTIEDYQATIAHLQSVLQQYNNCFLQPTPMITITGYKVGGGTEFDTTGTSGNASDWLVTLCVNNLCLPNTPLANIGTNSTDTSMLTAVNGAAITATLCEVANPANCLTDTKLIPDTKETESIAGGVLTWSVYNAAADTAHPDFLYTNMIKQFTVIDSNNVNPQLTIGVQWTNTGTYAVIYGTLPAYITITPTASLDGTCSIAIDMAAAYASGYDTFQNTVSCENIYTNAAISAVSNITENYENYQTINLVDTDEGITVCNVGVYDYAVFNTIDLSGYGGASAIAVTSDADVVAAFATVGITASVVGCSIHLVGYTGAVADVEVSKPLFDCWEARTPFVMVLPIGTLQLGDVITFENLGWNTLGTGGIIASHTLTAADMAIISAGTALTLPAIVKTQIVSAMIAQLGVINATIAAILIPRIIAINTIRFNTTKISTANDLSKTDIMLEIKVNGGLPAGATTDTSFIVNTVGSEGLAGTVTRGQLTPCV